MSDDILSDTARRDCTKGLKGGGGYDNKIRLKKGGRMVAPPKYFFIVIPISDLSVIFLRIFLLLCEVPLILNAHMPRLGWSAQHNGGRWGLPGPPGDQGHAPHL